MRPQLFFFVAYSTRQSAINVYFKQQIAQQIKAVGEEH